jgi:hypothetical protein
MKKRFKGQFNSLSCNSLLKTIDASIDHRGAKKRSNILKYVYLIFITSSSCYPIPCTLAKAACTRYLKHFTLHKSLSVKFQNVPLFIKIIFKSSLFLFNLILVIRNVVHFFLTWYSYIYRNVIECKTKNTTLSVISKYVIK